MTTQLPEFKSELENPDTHEIERIMSNFMWLGGVFLTVPLVALVTVFQVTGTWTNPEGISYIWWFLGLIVLYFMFAASVADAEVEAIYSKHKKQVKNEKEQWLIYVVEPLVRELYGLQLSSQQLDHLYDGWGYPVHTARGKITMNSGYLYVEKQVLKEILTKENDGNA